MALQQQQYQGKLLITINDAHIVNFNTHIVHSITNAISPTLGAGSVYCTMGMVDQVSVTPKAPRTTRPQWDHMHTFNVYDPFDEVSIILSEEHNGETRNFGKLTILLKDHSLVDQKLHELNLPISAIEAKDATQIGTLKLNVQYKYRKTWEALYKGTTALAKQQYPAAVALFTHHLNNQADMSSSLYMVYDYRCEAYCGMGKMQEALIDAQKVLELRPGSIPALIRLARVYVLRAEFADAEKILAQAQAIAPDDERVAREKEIYTNEELIYRISKKVKAAYVDFEKGSYVTAANLFSETIDEVSNSATVYLYRAICFAAVGHMDSCMSDIQRMLELQPGWPRTDAILEGSLQKRGGVNVMMKRRWFILKHCFLFYYKTNNDVQPQGIICLYKATCTVKGKREISISSENSKRVYEMKADTEDDRNKWHRILNEVINTKLSLPDTQDGAQIVANSRKIIQVNVVTDIFNKFHDGFFLPTKVVTTIGEKLIASLFTFELEPQDKRGWLYKKGRLTGDCEWARRFFVLKPPWLYYLNPSQDEDLSDGSVFVPRGYINLDTSQINPSPEKVSQDFAFEITPKSNMYLKQNIAKYMLSAESQADFDSWVSAIKKVTDPPVVEIARALPPKQAPEEPQFIASPVLLDPPRPTNLKPINYISDYKPPPDVLAVAPAIKDIPPPRSADTSDGPSSNGPNGPNYGPNGPTFYTPTMSPQYSLNYDPPPPGAKAKGLTDAESRFYKFGMPNPALAPPQRPYEDETPGHENTPLLADERTTPGDDAEEKKSCCSCTIL
eukprot:Phypoly_transcript_03312.p1 GENE.Phypoly_transcript_03312~~Phypoly_transcript_03312.p1  ORF type:complete len:787 (+),score=139.43 Phypoly_transcript_03312:93-2453(+)